MNLVKPINKAVLHAVVGTGIIAAGLGAPLICGQARAADLIHQYSFEADATDTISFADGSLVGNAYVEGGAVVLDGAGAYVDLPNDLISSYPSVSLEVWFTDQGSGTWARLWDLGNSDAGEGGAGTGTSYAMVGLADGYVRGAYKLAGQPEQNIDIAPRPGAGARHHLVWTSDAEAGQAVLYVDGVKAGANNALTYTPVTVGPTANDWLGRSQYGGDAYFKGSFSEFRIYEGILTPLEVAVNAAAGPEVTSTEPGTLISLSLQANETMAIGAVQTAAVFADFENIEQVNIVGLPGMVVTSSVPSVVSVVDGKQLVAVSAGSAVITAVYQGFTSTKNVTVAEIPAALVHRYSFDEAPGSAVAADSVSGADGEVYGGAAFDGSGTITFDGSSGYVNLPNGIISSLEEMSVETWVAWTGSRIWERIFDFGNSSGGEDIQGSGLKYLFLTPKSDTGLVRFAIRSSGFDNPLLDGNVVMPYGVERHLVVTYSPRRGSVKLYADGKEVGSAAASVPLRDILDINNWLGRSQYSGDGYFSGSMREFRIYRGVLTPLEIAASLAAGADAYAPDLGALRALAIQPITPLEPGMTQTPVVLAEFANVSGVNVAPWSSYVIENPNLASVNAQGAITALAEGMTKIIATYGGIKATQSLEVLHAPPTLAHRYTFDETPGSAYVADLVNGADGQVVGGAAFDGAGAITFDGSSGYVNLPNGIISSLDDMSLETWVTWTGNRVWERIFDFGSSNAGEDVPGAGQKYLFLTPWSDTGRVRFAIRTAANDNPLVEGATVMQNGVERHIVITYSSRGGSVKLYVDGKEVASAVATIPLSEITDINNWLGRSQWSGDAYFSGSMREFRIYQGILSPMEVVVSQAAGPDNQVPETGALQGLTVQPITPMEPGTVQTPVVLAEFANVSGVNVTSWATFEIVNPDIASVNAQGVITAVSLGTTKIIATYGGLKATQSVEVVHAPAVLAHRYSFEADATDTISFADGSLVGNAYVEGGAVVLDGAGAYVDLPNDLISSYPSVSLEVWFTDQGSGTWARLWDLGNSDAGEGSAGTGTSYAMVGLADGYVRGAYKLAGQPEQNLDIAPRPGPGARHHLVWTSDAEAGQAVLYVDGVRAGANNALTYTPVTVGPTANDWLGRSQYGGDAYFKGSFSEFRIYAGILTPLEVAVNAATGPEEAEVAPGMITGMAVQVSETMILESFQPLTVLADFEYIQGVNVTAVPGLVVTSSVPTVVSVVNGKQLVAAGAGSAVITAVYQGVVATRNITVTQAPAELVHRYSFSEAPGSKVAADSVGGADGGVLGGAVFDGAGTIAFDGSSGYVNLPNGIISSLEEMSVETWATWTGNRIWERLFDFGNNNVGEDVGGTGQQYLFLTPKSDAGYIRFAITIGSYTSDNPVVQGTAVMPFGLERHVVLTYSLRRGAIKLYVNGQRVATGVPAIALSAINDINNWLGRSQYSGDPYFKGSMNEFRIYSGILSEGDVADNFTSGPNQVPNTRPSLEVTRNGNQITIAWPSSAGASYQLEMSPTLGTGAAWTSAGAASLNNGKYSVTVSATDSARYFRLKKP